MRGRFFKALLVSVLPSVIIAGCALLMFFFVPGMRHSLDLILSGSFESLEARRVYFNTVIENYANTVSIIMILFSFLNVGSVRLMLDMLRGRDVKIRNIFSYYNKWYITIICPALSFALTWALSYMLEALMVSGADEAMVSALSWVLQIGVYFITFKLMFVDFILADTNCESFKSAITKSWNMVGWNTAINLVVLVFSFFGWFILSALTAGVAFIYMTPYMMIAQ
ncbi:MAG: hypothetical protein IKU60_01435, partial [Clostridia bacterium]|nr:hypothetical protein [Clostridia bacterium]